MIAWLERARPGAAVIPDDPVQRFVSLLVEDYADEWLWRPAMQFRWLNAPGPVPGRDPACRGDRPHPRRPLFERRRWVSRSARRSCSCAATGRRPADPRARRAAYLRPARLARADPHRAPVHARRPADDRRRRVDGAVLAPLRPRPDAGAADAGPRPGDLRVGGPNLERAGESDRRRTARRRDPGRLGPDPARDRRHAPRGAGAERRRLHRAREAARPDRPGNDLPRNPDQRRTGPGACCSCARATRSCPPRRRCGSARCSSGQGCWEPLWRVAEVACDHDPDGTAPFCQATRMVRD